VWPQPDVVTELPFRETVFAHQASLVAVPERLYGAIQTAKP